jgi:hypothetical protein
MDNEIKNKQRFGLFVVAILWLVVMTSGYYISHKPITLQQVIGPLNAIWSVIAALVWLSLAGGLGHRLFSALELHPLERLALQTTLGIGVWSVIILVWGSLVAISTGWVLGMIFLGGVLLWKDVISWWRTWGALRSMRDGGDSFSKYISLIISFIFLATLIVALGPPLKFDALVYHLTLPQNYLLNGRIAYDPENMFWGMPQVAQLSYLPMIALGGASAAAVYGWLIGLTASIGLLGFVVQRFDVRSAWVALAALFGGFSLAASLSWAYVDWHTILFGLSLLIALEYWVIKSDSKNLLIAGALAGLAIAVKYTAGVVFLGGILFVLAAGNSNKFKSIFIFGIGAVLAVFPWLLKNFLATGNPLYPFGIASGAMSPLRLTLYQSQPVEGNWLDFFLLPFRATFYGVENATIIGRPGYNSSLGPLLLGLAPLSLILNFQKEQWQFVRRIGLFSLVGVLIWGFGSRFSGHLIRTHLYFSLFPAFATLSGAGFAALGKLKVPNVRAERLGGTLVLLVLSLNLIQLGYSVQAKGYLEVIMGERTDRQYLEDNLGWYIIAMDSVKKLSTDERALLMWEPRGYYCAPMCDSDETLDHWLDAIRSNGDPNSVLRAWRQQGYTHLLYYDGGAKFIRESDEQYMQTEWQMLDTMLTTLPEIESFSDVYTLYLLETP